MAKIELKTEELVGLLQQMQGGAMGRPAPASSVMGQEAPRRSAEENLGMVQTLRAANPVQSPAAPGTITQARRQADEQAKLQREQMALQERLARLARARSGGGGSSGGNVSQVASLIKATTDAAARQGRSFSDVIQSLKSPKGLGMLEMYGISLEQAIQLAKQYYEPMLNFDSFATNANPPRHLLSPDMVLDTYNTRQGFFSNAQQDFQQYMPQQPDEYIREGYYRRPDGSVYQIGSAGGAYSLDALAKMIEEGRTRNNQ